jgi:hypothetical protein
VNGLTVNAWNHVLITFDGGTTGVDVADLSDYYSRFTIFIDGVDTSAVGSHVGNGFSGVINGANVSTNIYRIGRNNNVNNQYYDGLIDSVAIWDSDQTANVAGIYNGGAVHDLSLLVTTPEHYYEFENDITSINDLQGSANLTNYNFVTGDLVTDTP